MDWYHAINLCLHRNNQEYIGNDEVSYFYFFCPGKYALKPIINTLPLEKQKENVPDRTICAAVALLQEVLKNSIDFAQYVMVLGHLFGFITCSTQYSPAYVLP